MILVGEKLSEPQVIKALAGTRGFLVPRTKPTGYLLCVEDTGPQTEGESDALVARTEVALSANPYYAQACRLGQLSPLAFCIACPMASLRISAENGPLARACVIVR